MTVWVWEVAGENRMVKRKAWRPGDIEMDYMKREDLQELTGFERLRGKG